MWTNLNRVKFFYKFPLFFYIVVYSFLFEDVFVYRNITEENRYDKLKMAQNFKIFLDSYESLSIRLMRIL